MDMALIPLDIVVEPVFGLALAACCLLAIIVFVIIFILAFVFKMLIEFLPATIAAVVVYMITGDLVLAGISFLVVALIMAISRKNKRRDRRYH